jgi:hypothetical protein
VVLAALFVPLTLGALLLVMERIETALLGHHPGRDRRAPPAGLRDAGTPPPVTLITDSRRGRPAGPARPRSR